MMLSTTKQCYLQTLETAGMAKSGWNISV